jgi:hypothetical protein
VVEYHSHNGFGVPVPGRRSTCNRITVPSTIGNSSSCPAQAPTRVSLVCNVDGQHDPALVAAGNGLAGQDGTESVDVQAAVVKAVIEAARAAAVFGGQ